MRVMNGRLHNLIRSPLIRNKFLNNNKYDSNNDENDANNNSEQETVSLENGTTVIRNSEPHHKHHHNKNRHQHKHHNRKNRNSMNAKSKQQKQLRRRSSEERPLPKSIQFDESSDAYRCLCGCFHVKTGAMCIAGIEIFLIFCYFVNALTVLLQQKEAYGNGRVDKAKIADSTSADYVPIAFIITSVALAFALITVLLMIVGLTRNIASLLIPHILVQAISILCFTGLLLIGIVALVTDHAYFYRMLNAAPFNDYPGQATVALDAETMVRIHLVLALYALSLALELWFIVIIYNCNLYFKERRKYMNYCLAYSTPMKTLNSARYN